VAVGAANGFEANGVEANIVGCSGRKGAEGWQKGAAGEGDVALKEDPEDSRRATSGREV